MKKYRKEYRYNIISVIGDNIKFISFASIVLIYFYSAIIVLWNTEILLFEL